MSRVAKIECLIDLDQSAKQWNSFERLEQAILIKES